MEETHYRLFVAIESPEAIKEQIAKVQGELKRIIPEAKVSWTKPEQLHLTLKFLGNVDATQVDALHEALRAACKDFGPLRLAAQGIGAFRDWQRPRVVWAGVNDDQDRLTKLQQLIEVAVSPFTKEEPEGQFTGHVTLARVKWISRPETRTLAATGEAFAEKVFGEWTIGGLAIMRSELSSAGARHTELFRVPL